MNIENEILEWAAEKMEELECEGAFHLKTRHLGGIFDLNTLRRRGWTLDTANGKPDDRDGSLWLRQKAHGHEIVLEFGTPQVTDSAGAFDRHPKLAEGGDLKAMLEGQGSMQSYLRGLRMDPDPDGHSLNLIEWRTDVRELIDSDLGEAEEQAPLPFLEDLKWQTDGYRCEEPWPLATPIEKRLEILCRLISRKGRPRWSTSFQRLAAPLVRALVCGDSRAEEALKDCRHAQHLIYLLWTWNTLDNRGSGATFLALSRILKRILDGSLETSSWDWTGIGEILSTSRDYESRIVCASRALRPGHPDHRRKQGSDLWTAVTLQLKELAKHEPNAIDHYRLHLALQALLEHEDILVRHIGYWTLLGLGYMLDGQPQELVRSTMEKGLPAHSGSLDMRRTDPLAWSGWVIARHRDLDAARNQILSFPNPLFDILRDLHLPAEPMNPKWQPKDLWTCLCPGYRTNLKSWIRTLETDSERDITGQVHSTVKVYETPACLTEDPGVWRGEAVGAVGLTTLSRNVADIVPLLTWSHSGRKQNRHHGVLIPFARKEPVEENQNFSGKTEFLHVHPDGTLAEADFEIDGFGKLRVLVPFYAADQSCIREKDERWKGYLYGIGCRMGAPSGTERPPEPAEGDLPVHRFRGRVESVEKATVHGGEDILKITLVQENSARFPVYLHPSRLEGEAPRPGDWTECDAVPNIDLFG